MKKYREILLFLVFLVIGFLYRYLLSASSYTELFSDSYRYHELAIRMLSFPWQIDCCEKNAGYPAFLALIYHFFGPNNYVAIRFSQIFLDLLASILIYFSAKNLFNKNIAIIAFFLYLSNPFTSAFTGIRIAESLTFFCVSVIVFILTLPSFKTNKFLWMVWGGSLGLLLFVRLQFQLFVLSIIALVGIFTLKKYLKIICILLAYVGFFLVSSYSLISNYLNFQKISLSAPYTMIWHSFYFSFYSYQRWPELFIEGNGFNEITAPIYHDYWDTPLKNRPEVEKKYRIMFFDKLKTEWPLFLNNYYRNMIWGWDKYHLSEWIDPYYPFDTWPLRIYNIILFVLMILGLYKYVRIKKLSILKNPLFVFTVFLFLYITFVFSLIDNETRHRLPFYMPLMIWASFGVNFLFQKIKNRNFSHT